MSDTEYFYAFKEGVLHKYATYCEDGVSIYGKDIEGNHDRYYKGKEKFYYKDELDDLYHNASKGLKSFMGEHGFVIDEYYKTLKDFCSDNTIHDPLKWPTNHLAILIGLLGKHLNRLNSIMLYIEELEDER
jgi:hypothetical protein